MRPRYERPIDVQNEAEAMDILISALAGDFTWDVDGKNRDFDATLYRGGAFYCDVEVKTRSDKFFEKARNKGLVLESPKWLRLQSEDVILVVYWIPRDKGQGVYLSRPKKIPETDVPIYWGGRTRDTRDERDIGYMAYIPWKHFTWRSQNKEGGVHEATT
jgi:hypothetical protein|tara:strand:+ start:1025 stop:1504 length:480 start_codon:yes stop_codon:yes gene_type:complete